MAERLPFQFAAPAQQRDAVSLGMWIFLGTELMLFGALFVGYTIYRIEFHDVWPHASGKLHAPLGTINTAILLTSSLCMALADLGVQRRSRRFTLGMLALTAVLGLAFLGIKFYEYSRELHEHLVPLPWLPFHYTGPAPEAAELFFNFYFTMTGLHAVHLSVGMLLVLIQVLYVWRWNEPERLERRVAVTGLYWHFVDVIWVFLYPLLYLM